MTRQIGPTIGNYNSWRNAIGPTFEVRFAVSASGRTLRVDLQHASSPSPSTASDNGNVHRAAAKDMQAEKAARPAAPCATYCYVAVNAASICDVVWQPKRPQVRAMQMMWVRARQLKLLALAPKLQQQNPQSEQLDLIQLLQS